MMKFQKSFVKDLILCFENNLQRLDLQEKLDL